MTGSERVTRRATAMVDRLPDRSLVGRDEGDDQPEPVSCNLSWVYCGWTDESVAERIVFVRAVVVVSAEDTAMVIIRPCLTQSEARSTALIFSSGGQWLT